VIIPAYNRRDLLPQALESLVRQTYPGWEAIVVDDGSSDDTYDVARSFAERDPRIRALKLEENVGVGEARNAGIRTSGAELLFLLDTDDYLYEQCLERLVEAYDDGVAAGRHVGVVSVNARILTPSGFAADTWIDRYGTDGPVNLDSMIKANHLLARALLPRAAYDEVGGGFARECKGTDDYDLWLRLLERGYEAITVAEPLAVYRHHPGADSRDYRARSDGTIAAYRRALERGALTRRQRLAVRRQIIHYSALRDREGIFEAIVNGRRARAAVLAVRAAPVALAAFAQRPSRWSAWLRGLLRPDRDLERVRGLHS
jgi:glycosyltransferase involved in cell wall biosynthesis